MYLSLESKKTAGEKAQEADAEILEAIKSRRKLASDMELAQGIQYTEPLETRYAEYLPVLSRSHIDVTNISWRPPRYIRDRTADQDQKLRDKYHILVEGEDIPPPIEHFTVRTLPSKSLARALIPEIGYENSRTYPRIPTL